MSLRETTALLKSNEDRINAKERQKRKRDEKKVQKQKEILEGKRDLKSLLLENHEQVFF